MKTPAAFRATYSDWKLIRTRKVVQIVLEVPVEEANIAYQVLGGMPNPAESFWCAVARLREGGDAPESTITNRTVDTSPAQSSHQPTGRAKRSWDELKPSAQISIRCGETAFRRFLKEKFPRMWNLFDKPDDDLTPLEVAILLVRNHCGVASRSDINADNPQALDAWQRLEWDYRAWQQAPAVGAVA